MHKDNINILSHHQGFTLLEVLIALLVLSIGLLGLAGLQTLSLKSNHSAYLRAQATLLTYDILDKMRANRNEAVGTTSYLTSFDGAPAGATNCTTANCIPASMASFDLSQWKCTLGKWNDHAVCTALGITGSLPNGDGSITVNNGVYTISVRYEERDGTPITLQISSRI